MASILIADTPQRVSTLERILAGHELRVVHTMADANLVMERRTFDLVVAALHFDESQMFAMIRAVKASERNANKPIVCFCSRDTPLSKLMHESLEISTKVFGAWTYLAESAYVGSRDPDAEIRQVIERCLSGRWRQD